jgi:hypothetical protein
MGGMHSNMPVGIPALTTIAANKQYRSEATIDGCISAPARGNETGTTPANDDYSLLNAQRAHGKARVEFAVNLACNQLPDSPPPTCA